MKARLYAIMFLVCLLAGLRNNAMDNGALVPQNKAKENKQLMIRTAFGAIQQSSTELALKSKMTKKHFLDQLTLIANNASFTPEDLNAESKHSGRTFLQEAAYHLRSSLVKKLLLLGANPTYEGTYGKSPSTMLRRHKIKKRFINTNRFGRKIKSLKSLHARSLSQCLNLLDCGEKCWEHREGCNSCQKLHTYNGEEAQKCVAVKDCCHHQECFFCERRLQEINKSNRKISKKV